MIIKPKVALYPRVSTFEQAQYGHSIREQIERMKKYCEAMGWEVYQVYTDAGYSGADMERPALQRMVTDIEANRVNKVLVYKLDRLSRSQKDTLTLIEDVFLANGCDFVSMTENLDTSTPFGKAMIGILAVFAQLEREQIKERMDMGREARAKLGKFHGSDKVPLGYDYVDGELVTNEFEKLQIQQIFKMFSEGVSAYRIERTLNEAGLTHRHGKWYAKTIRILIQKRTYLGYIHHKGLWFKGNHEPFVTEEIFNKVQEIRRRKSEEHKKYNRRGGKANSFLGGYMYCKQCNAKYGKAGNGRPRKDGTKLSYYQCNSRHKKSPHLIKDPNCRNKNHRVDILDERVFSEIKKLAIDPDYFDQIKDSSPVDDRHSVIENEIHKLDTQMNKLMDLYTIGNMPVEALQDRIAGLNEKKQKLEQELSDIKKEKEKLLSQEVTIELATSFSDILERGDFDEIRTVMSTLIDKIVIDEDEVTIHWAFV